MDRVGDASLLWDSVKVLETSVDDVTGEVLGNLIDELIAFGACDAIVIPATMKKGRSGHLILMNCKTRGLDTDRTEDHRGDGFAWRADIPTKHRLIAKRRMESVRIKIDGAKWDAAVKIATDEGGCILSISAEFEDAKTIAREDRCACARGDAQDRRSCMGI